MAFDADVTASIKTTDPRSLESTTRLQALKGQGFIERVLPAGTHDLSPHLANISNLKAVMIEALDSDFLVALDGVNFGPRKHSLFLFSIKDSGAQPLQITLTAESRVRLAAVGD